MIVTVLLNAECNLKKRFFFESEFFLQNSVSFSGQSVASCPAAPAADVAFSLAAPSVAAASCPAYASKL